MSKLRPLIPIKLETREVEVLVPAKYASHTFTALKRVAHVTKDEWKSDGSLRAVIQIPAGIQENIEAEVNKLTKGDAEFKILSKK